ncbi:hypothetical protein ACFL0W_03460 [Nanoarchaeota archaeon]
MTRHSYAASKVSSEIKRISDKFHKHIGDTFAKSSKEESIHLVNFFRIVKHLEKLDLKLEDDVREDYDAFSKFLNDLKSFITNSKYLFSTDFYKKNYVIEKQNNKHFTRDSFYVNVQKYFDKEIVPYGKLVEKEIRNVKNIFNDFGAIAKSLGEDEESIEDSRQKFIDDVSSVEFRLKSEFDKVAKEARDLLKMRDSKEARESFQKKYSEVNPAAVFAKVHNKKKAISRQFENDFLDIFRENKELIDACKEITAQWEKVNMLVTGKKGLEKRYDKLNTLFDQDPYNLGEHLVSYNTRSQRDLFFEETALDDVGDMMDRFSKKKLYAKIIYAMIIRLEDVYNKLKTEFNSLLRLMVHAVELAKKDKAALKKATEMIQRDVTTEVRFNHIIIEHFLRLEKGLIGTRN